MEDPFQLAIYLTGDEESWQEAIEQKYDMPYEQFEALINDLLPLIVMATAPLSGETHKGFADTSQRLWLAKAKEEK